MPPKRPPTDAMTLHELGINDIDCGLDPDGMLDGPPADAGDVLAELDATDEDVQVALERDGLF